MVHPSSDKVMRRRIWWIILRYSEFAWGGGGGGGGTLIFKMSFHILISYLNFELLKRLSFLLAKRNQQP